MRFKKKKLVIAIQCLLLNSVAQAATEISEPQSLPVCNYAADSTCLYTMAAWLYPVEYDANVLNLEDHFNLASFGYDTPPTLPIFGRDPLMIEQILQSPHSMHIKDIVLSQPWFRDLTVFSYLNVNRFNFFKLSRQPLYTMDYHRIGWFLNQLPNYQTTPQDRAYAVSIAQQVTTDYGSMILNVLKDNHAIYGDENMSLRDQGAAHTQALALLETFFYLDWSAGAALSIQPATPAVYNELIAITEQHLQSLKSIYDANIHGELWAESLQNLFQQPHMQAVATRPDVVEAEPEPTMPPLSQSMIDLLDQLKLDHPTAYQHLLHWLDGTKATAPPDWNSDIWLSPLKPILTTWQQTNPESYMQNMMHELDFLLALLNMTDLNLNDVVLEYETQTIRSFLFEKFHQVWQRGWAIQNLYKNFGDADIFNNLLIKFFFKAAAEVNQSDWSHATEVLMSQNLQYIQTRLIRALILNTNQPLPLYRAQNWIQKIETFMEANLHQINLVDSIRWRAMLDWYKHFYYLQKPYNHNILPLSQAYHSTENSLFKSITRDFDTPMGSFQNNLEKIKDYEVYDKELNKKYHDYISQKQFRTRSMRIDIESSTGLAASGCRDYNCIVENYQQNSNLDQLKQQSIVAIRKMEVAQQNLTNNIDKINQFLVTFQQKIRLNNEILSEMSRFHEIEVELKKNLQKTQSLANKIAEPMSTFGSIMAGISKVVAAAYKPWSIIEGIFVGVGDVAKTARTLVAMEKQHLIELRTMDAKNEHTLKMKQLDQELGLLGDMTKLNDLLLEQSRIIKTMIQEKDAVAASITKFKATVNRILIKQNFIDKINTINDEKFHLDLTMDSRHETQIKLWENISYIQKHLSYAKSTLLFEWQNDNLADELKDSSISPHSSAKISEQISNYVFKLKNIYQNQHAKFIQKRSDISTISLKKLLAASSPHVPFQAWLAHSRVSNHGRRYTLHFSTLPHNEMMFDMLNPPNKFDGDSCHYQPGHVLKHIEKFAVSFTTQTPVNQNQMGSNQVMASLSYGGQQYFAAPKDGSFVNKWITQRFLKDDQIVDTLSLPIDVKLTQGTLDLADHSFNYGLQGQSSAASDWSLDFYLNKNLPDISMIDDIQLILKQNYYTYRPTCP